MSTVGKLSDALFGESNPGGFFLLSLASGVLVLLLQDRIKSKMNQIARTLDPTLNEDSAYARIMLQSAEVWTNSDWRKLKFRHTFLGYVSAVPLLFGMWFGFNSLIVVVGTLLGW